MAGDTSLRGRIHGVWETFFPSSLYLALFLATLLTLTQGDDWQLALQGIFAWMTSFKNGPAYTFLKEFKLEATVPFGMLLAAAAVVYLFDRAVFFVARILPPVMAWTGSPAIYADMGVVINFWGRVPEEREPRNLHIRAKAIVDEAIAVGKAPSWVASDRDAARRRYSSVVQATGYCKVGTFFAVSVTLFMLVVGDLPPGFAKWAVIAVAGFFTAFLINYAKSTIALIRDAEQDMAAGAMVLNEANATLDPGEGAELEDKLVEALRGSPRFFRFQWRRKRPRGANLLSAMLGFTIANRLGLVKRAYRTPPMPLPDRIRRWLRRSP
jgi:hypothetical protein